MTDINSSISVVDLCHDVTTSHVRHGNLLAKFDDLVARGLVIYSPSKILKVEDAGFHVSQLT